MGSPTSLPTPDPAGFFAGGFGLCFMIFYVIMMLIWMAYPIWYSLKVLKCMEKTTEAIERAVEILEQKR